MRRQEEFSKAFFRSLYSEQEEKEQRPAGYLREHRPMEVELRKHPQRRELYMIP